jgi:hypothetical protein
MKGSLTRLDLKLSLIQHLRYNFSACTSTVITHSLPRVQALLAPWPKDKKQIEISRYVRASMLDSIESYIVAFLTRALSWSLAETRVSIPHGREEGPA